MIIAELKVVAKDDTEVKLEQQEDICRYNEITIEVLEKYSELGEEKVNQLIKASYKIYKYLSRQPETKTITLDVKEILTITNSLINPTVIPLANDPSRETIFVISAGDVEVEMPSRQLPSKSLISNQVDESNIHRLTDNQLRIAAKEVMGTKYDLTGEIFLNEQEKQIVAAYKERFKDEITARQNAVINMWLSTPMRITVEKLSGKKIGSSDPLDMISEVIGGSKIVVGKTLNKPKLDVEQQGINTGSIQEAEMALEKFKELEVKATTPLQQKIEQVTGIAKPELVKKERDYLKALKGIDSWANANKYVNKIPKELGMPNYADKGAGIKWEMKSGDRGQHTNVMYKIARANFDVGRTHPKYRFDIDKNPAKKNAAKHIDAHIPADQWYKWRDIWKP